MVDEKLRRENELVCCLVRRGRGKENFQVGPRYFPPKPTQNFYFRNGEKRGMKMLTKLERKKNNLHFLLSPTPLNCHFPISDLNPLTLASSVFRATVRTQLLFFFFFFFPCPHSILLSLIYSLLVDFLFLLSSPAENQV